jgi:outer membrane receptor protein involved in Fe transport
VNYTWLDAEVLAVDGVAGQAPSPFAPGDRLLRRPRHQGSVSAFWTLSRWQMFGSATMRGTTLDVEPNFGSFGGLFENEGHAVVNAGGAWTVRPQVAVVARVVNLFAAGYEDTLGYPALGRTAYVGVRVTARR